MSHELLESEHDFHKPIHWTSQFLYIQSTNFIQHKKTINNHRVDAKNSKISNGQF